MERRLASLLEWSPKRIDGECGAAYGLYERELKAHYVAYFSRNRHLRCRRHPYSAATIAAALPPGWEHLQRLIPSGAFHRYARSGRSSQVLALALLGSCSVEDPSLAWLSDALGLSNTRKRTEISPFAFEYSLAPEDLNEEPRVTTIDYIARINGITVVMESKWSERGGLGRCSCLRDDGNPNEGGCCASRVEARPAYWQIASENFGLPATRNPLGPCSLSLAYQAVRNVAAARVLSGNSPAFVRFALRSEQSLFQQSGRLARLA